MVHNQTMGNAQKMWYLKMNVTGEAEKLIRHLQLSDDNYMIAWNSLKNRYENKRLQVTALLDQLMTQPMIQQESSIALKRLHDTTKECILNLENLSLSVKQHWDPIIVHTILKKLDTTTHSLFEQSITSPKDLQSVDKLLNFIEMRFQALEALGHKLTNKQQSKSSKSSVLVTNQNDRQKCLICNENHPIYYYNKFLNMNIHDRQNEAKKFNLCLNCLKKGHTVNKCTSRGCTKYSRKHNTLLHYNEKNNYKQSRQSDRSIQEATSLTTNSQEHQESYIFLGTALAEIMDRDGNMVQARILLDSGSQINLITEKFKQKLKLDNTHTIKH